MQRKFHIDPDISKAETLPASFYRDTEIFQLSKEKVFCRSWHWIGHESLVANTQEVFPFTLLEDFLHEPLVLTRDAENLIHCLSNVCTHRANIVVNAHARTKKLICGYHGRRFKLDGTFEFMPEFKEAQDFPRNCDHLHPFPLDLWGPFLFAGLNPGFELKEVLSFLDERIGFLPLHKFKLDEARGKDYYINTHWALYCDNYLEGFHIPFVHEGLNEVLDYGNYETLLHTHANLQIGYAGDSEAVFDLPKDHIDHGKKVAAYYFWVFPNMMFNFYPWGLSVNIVQPIGIARTKVSFRSYVYDETKLEKGAGAALDKVEMEDEEVVEGVQRGLNSRFYKSGRFSPKREKGVHHFHRLLAEFMNAES